MQLIMIIIFFHALPTLKSYLAFVWGGGGGCIYTNANVVDNIYRMDNLIVLD